MFPGEVANLSALGTHDLVSVGQMLVDEFLVCYIDEGRQKDNAGSQEGDTPERHDSDKIVRNQRGGKGLCELVCYFVPIYLPYRDGMHDVLGEENPLKLNHEEVGELFNIFERGFQNFAGDGGIFPRAD